MEWISVDEIEKGFGDGDLTLGIFCTKCNRQYELNKESIVIAIGMNTSLIDYVRYVQSSKCPHCGKE